ncbi:MAG: polysaccharide biosynthesis/export family protein [Tenuifilaceae bacterium]
MRKITILRSFFLLTILVVVLSSCNRRAQLLYMNNIGYENLITQPVSPYLLKPGDVLYVQILTQDPNVSNLFNNRGFSGGAATNIFSSEVSYYLYGYSLSDSGQIHLPVLGKLIVGGLTIDQARERIQNETQKYLTDGLAVVKLLSYKVTVLGEVKRPGSFTNFKDNLSIFEAIAMAGDLADYGERSTVMVVRQTPDGVKSFRVNLHDKSIINSEAYYLLPNDMIIVEPRKGKIFSMNSPNISMYISILTTTLLLINYFK